MSADAGGVRLWHNYYAPTSYHSYVTDEGAVLAWERADPYIAYPAAQAAAMERVVRAARVLEFRYCDDDWSDDAWERAVEELRAAISTLPRAHGGEGGG